MLHRKYNAVYCIVYCIEYLIRKNMGMLLVYILTGFLLLKYLLDYSYIACQPKLGPNMKTGESRHRAPYSSSTNIS